MLKPFVQNFDSLDSLWAKCFLYNSLHKIGEVCRVLAWSLHSTRASPWCWPVGPSCICQWLDDTAPTIHTVHTIHAVQAQRGTCEHWEPWSCRLGRPCLFQSTSFDAERRSSVALCVLKALIVSLVGSIPMQVRSKWIASCGKLNPREIRGITCWSRFLVFVYARCNLNCAMQSGQLPTRIDVKNVALASRETWPYNLTTQQASSPHFKTNLHKGFLQSPSPLDVGIWRTMSGVECCLDASGVVLG